MWGCRLPVHIGPADCSFSAEIFGEFATAQRVDVGIDPYNECAGAQYLSIQGL